MKTKCVYTDTVFAAREFFDNLAFAAFIAFGLDVEGVEVAFTIAVTDGVEGPTIQTSTPLIGHGVVHGQAVNPFCAKGLDQSVLVLLNHNTVWAEGKHV